MLRLLSLLAFWACSPQPVDVPAPPPEPLQLPAVVLRPALPVGRTVTELLEGVPMEREWTVEAQEADGIRIHVTTAMPSPVPEAPPLRVEQAFVLGDPGIVRVELLHDDVSKLMGSPPPADVPPIDRMVFGACGMPADAVLLPSSPVSVGDAWDVGATTRCELASIASAMATVTCHGADAALHLVSDRTLTVDLGQRLVVACEQTMTQGSNRTSHSMRARGHEF